MGLLSELKRRNVLRMAVLYALSSWLIMQVAEVLMTLAALPEWTGQVTLVVLAIGFPIALVFSWFYELTPEGLSLEKEVPAGESITHLTGRRIDFIVIAVLSAALIVFAYDKWWISGPPITSVAVLPLADFGMESEQQYLADGMTEVLTAQLGQIKSLQVVSRTSAMHYKDTTKLLPQIAEELGVDAIVEGSLQPAGDKIRFTMQLVDGRTDRHLWARSYQRDLSDLLTLQGEIARAIADQIEISLTPRTEARLARQRTTDSEALRLWAVGVHHLHKLSGESYAIALRAFVEASERDSEFPNAYAGIAHAYLLLGSWAGSEDPRTVFPLAKLAADKALQLDPDLAEAHFALAKIHWNDWQWEAAEREFRKATELSPSPTDGYWLVEYANFLTSMGRTDEAIEIGERAVALDPLSPLIHNELAFAFYMAGRNEDALKQFQQSLQLDPDFLQTHGLLVWFYEEAGERDKALHHLEVWAKDIESQPPAQIGYIGEFYARFGLADKACQILELLLERNETDYVPAIAIAMIYIGLEEYDMAVPWFEAAHEERDLSLVWFRHETAFPEEIRFDPIIQAIIADLSSY
jgi:TolB-like protein